MNSSPTLLVNVRPVGRAAHLAGVQEATGLDGPDREVEVGVRHDDDRSAAAELEAHLGDVLRGELHDPGARPDAAGDGHHADERVRGQLLADDRSVAAHEVDDARGHLGLVEDAAELERAVRGDLARLHDDRVARQERGRHLAGEDIEREVPGHDPADDADRLPEQQLHLVGPVAGDDLALDPAGPFSGVVEVVRGPVDLAPRLVEGLALLLGQHPGEVLGVLPDPIGDPVQIAGALDRRQLLPLALGPVGELDRLPGVLDGRVGDIRHGGAGGRVLDHQRLAALRVDEPTVHVVLVAASCDSHRDPPGCPAAPPARPDLDTTGTGT